MTIQNDQIIIEAADLSSLSTAAKSALASAAKQRSFLLEVPKGSTEPAEYVTAVLRQILEMGKRLEVSSQIKGLSKALLNADASKRSQAESLIDQAKAVLGA